jgi:phosphoribosylglycinamide formyltransferase-1
MFLPDVLEGQDCEISPMTRKLSLGVLASHGGSNLQAVMDACRDGRLDASVEIVISNNSTSRALQRAADAGIPAIHLSRATHADDDALDEAICGALIAHGVDLLLLAGYMRPLGPKTLSRYDGRTLNSHPALLPRYGGKGMYGSHVHEAVIAAGETVTGITIHQVDERYDHGPAIAQCEVPVPPGDTVETLTARVQAREHDFWIETLQKIAKGEIRLHALERQALGSSE